MIRVGTTSGTGGIRVASTAYAASQPDEAAPVLTLAHPAAFAVGSVDIAVTGDEAGTTYLVITATSDKPSKAQVKAGQDHESSTAEASANASGGVGEQTFSGVTVSAGYWYAHLMREDGAENQSDVVSTVQFRVAGSEHFGIVTTPAGDSVFPEEAEDGDYYFVDVVSGTGVDVLSNGSTSSESESWSTNAQIWDQSLNGGLGGLSEVYAVSFAPPVGGAASVEAIAAVTASGLKNAQGAASVEAEAESTASGSKSAQGAAQAASGAAVTAQGSKAAFGAAAVSAIAQATARGTIPGVEGEGAAEVEAVASVTASGRKNAQGAAQVGAVASATAQGVIEGDGSGRAEVVSIASVSAGGRKWVPGTASVTSIASVTVSGVAGQPGSLAWEVTVEASRDSQHLGTYTAGDDIKITLPLGENIAGLQSAKFTLARRGEGLIEKGLGEGVLVVDANDGVLSIVIGADDTEGLSGLLGWEVEVVDVFGNHRTPAFGLIYLRQAIIANAI